MKRAGRSLFVVLGLFFGFGFVAGFYVGFGYSRHLDRVATVIAASEDVSLDASAVAPEARPTSGEARAKASESEDELAEEILSRNTELVLVEHELGSDENGVFLCGTVENRSSHAFDAVQVSFELYDKSGKAYGNLTERNTERMEPGDAWGFTAYIPYSELDRFSSYKLYGIVGTSRK